MNNSSNQDSATPQNEANEAPKDTANSQASPPAGPSPLDPFLTAVNEGAQRAKAAAEKAIPKVRAAVCGATYWLGYGVSFATVFSYTVVKELAPEPLKAGCRAGAAAGQEKAATLAAKLSGQGTNPSTNPSPGPEPSGPATQAGAA